VFPWAKGKKKQKKKRKKKKKRYKQSWEVEKFWSSYLVSGGALAWRRRRRRRRRERSIDKVESLRSCDPTT
jgi:hypothetical protein